MHSARDVQEIRKTLGTAAENVVCLLLRAVGCCVNALCLQTVPLTFSRLYDEQSAIHHLDYPNHSSGHSDIVPTSGNSILGLKNPEPITSRQGLLETNKCLPMSAADVKNTRWNGAARFKESPAVVFAPKIDSPNVA